MHDLRTEKEIERDKTHDRICHEFSTLVAEHPKAAPHRIAAAVGEMVGMTAPGVIKVLTVNTH